MVTWRAGSPLIFLIILLMGVVTIIAMGAVMDSLPLPVSHVSTVVAHPALRPVVYPVYQIPINPPSLFVCQCST